MRNAIKRLIRERREANVRSLSGRIEVCNAIIEVADEEIWPLVVQTAHEQRASLSRDRANLLAKLERE